MSDAHENARLNGVLIRVHRSLLQYAVDCWPWTGTNDSVRERTIRELAREQAADIARLVELLVDREWTVDFGAYPDFSELHYVALDYLLAKLVADEQWLVGELERARPGLAGDAEAEALVSELLAAERRRLAKVREIAGTPAAAA